MHKQNGGMPLFPVAGNQQRAGELYIPILERDLFRAVRIRGDSRRTPQNKLPLGGAVLEFSADGIARHYTVEHCCREISDDLEVNGRWAEGDFGERDADDTQLIRTKGSRQRGVVDLLKIE